MVQTGSDITTSRKIVIAQFGAFLIHVLVYCQNSFDILPEISNMETIHIPIIDFWSHFQNVI